VQVLEFDKLGKREVDEVTAGDVCAVVGVEGADIGDTIADPENAVALPPIQVDEPTLDMVFASTTRRSPARTGRRSPAAVCATG